MKTDERVDPVTPPHRERMAALNRRARESLRSGSVNSRIARAIFTVGALALLVKAVALLKDLLLAHSFGIGAELDAYFTAFIIPEYAMHIVVGAFRSAVLPIYVEVRENQGREAANDLVRQVTAMCLLMVVGILALLGIAAPLLLPLIASGFSPETLELTRTLYFILLPTVVVAAFGIIWTAVLNADERNVFVGLNPIVIQVIPLLTLVVLGPHVSIKTLAVATLVAYLAEATLAGIVLKRRGARLLPTWRGLSPELRVVMRQYLPLTAGAAIVGSSLLIDQAIAATLDEGSVASLSYAAKAPAVLIGVAELALTAAVLPQFSRLVAGREWAELQRTYWLWLRLVFGSMLAVALVAAVLARPTIRLLFERGQFTADDTATVASLQYVYLIYVPLFCAKTLMVRMISALRHNHFLAVFAVVTLTLNVVGNIVFVQLWGLVGIIMSTVFNSMVSVVYIGFITNRLLKSRQVGPGPIDGALLPGAVPAADPGGT